MVLKEALGEQHVKARHGADCDATERDVQSSCHPHIGSSGPLQTLPGRAWQGVPLGGEGNR